MYRAAAVLALVLSSTPALADAVTYLGTLGKLPIVVELADPALDAGLGFGRYAYMRKGIDIPLDPLDSDEDTLAFVEELPCSEDTCALNEDGSPIVDGPIGATWELHPEGDGLVGTWTDDDKSLPIKLTRIGSRATDNEVVTTPGSLQDITIDFLYGDATLTRESDPYDYAKMQVEQTLTTETDWDGMSFRYVADPRVGLQFPRLVAAGGTDLSPANAYLESRQFAMNADAFNCKSRIYAAMGYMGEGFGGTLGGWDEETVTVTYLSPQMLAWTEGGSLSCGGAHPNNHFDYHTLDLATGEPIDMAVIFEGWNGSPPERLVEFVKANRAHDDADWEAECEIDDLIGQYLAVEFKQDRTVTFALSGLPHAIMACSTDLYSAPLLELIPYLASSAENYFPALAD